MKRPSTKTRRLSGFTLPEVLLGAVATSIVLGGLMMGSIAIQRSFSASDRLSRAQADLHRVADYMARDIRNATTVNTASTATLVLTVTSSDYYNRNGTPTNTADDTANNPTLGRDGATYGANAVTIRYLRTGDQIFREVSRIDGGTTTKTTASIADNVQNLTVAVDAAGMATISSSAPMQFGRRKAGAPTPTISFLMASTRRN